MTRATEISVIADDYGLSPGVSEAIRLLLEQGRIDGTSCMTVFPEWSADAEALLPIRSAGTADIGLHLTLTDFAPLSGKSPVKGEARLPGLQDLIIAAHTGSVDEQRLEVELDLQLQRFTEMFGAAPDFIDGHQHVHFLPPVRRWLENRTAQLLRLDGLPWLRGQPALRGTPDWRSFLKIGTVGFLARGFDRRMKDAGFPVRGPLVGFYDWTGPANFRQLMDRWEKRYAGGAVLMCHPGKVDAVLRSKDQLVEARAAEYEALLQRKDRRAD